MISKLTNAHKCMTVYYTHRKLSTCLGHSCDHLQGGALQRADITEESGTMHRYKIQRD